MVLKLFLINYDKSKGGMDISIVTTTNNKDHALSVKALICLLKVKERKCQSKYYRKKKKRINLYKNLKQSMKIVKVS